MYYKKKSLNNSKVLLMMSTILTVIFALLLYLIIYLTHENRTILILAPSNRENILSSAVCLKNVTKLADFSKFLK